MLLGIDVGTGVRGPLRLGLLLLDLDWQDRCFTLRL